MILQTEQELYNIRCKNKSKTIVLCHGCFDIFHYGHLFYLKESKSLGDILVVSITNDMFINKGITRPIFNGIKRTEIVNELKCVDYTYIVNEYTSIGVIQTLQPNIYSKSTDVKGKELIQTENLYHEKKAILSYGGKLVFISAIPEISSTSIINKTML
jgi:rfaE bifunctional protein nucleotidyltransferase chain/domain